LDYRLILVVADANLLLHKVAAAVMRMDALKAFGLIAVTLMLLFYSLEDRSPHFILGFALACWMGAAYGFLQGA
jgi:hypothetical protein